MTIIEHLRAYFQQYPGLAGERLDIDCLASAADNYSIDSVPCESVVSRYLDGSSVRRCLFTISSRRYYGQDLTQQAENLAIFEGLESWLEQKLRFLQLPTLGERRRARAVHVLSSAYPIIIDDDTGTARYQIQCDLIYTQEVSHESF